MVDFMKKINALSQDEINAVNGGNILFVLENKQDTNNICSGRKAVIAKIAVVVCITAVVIVLINKVGFYKNDQLRDIEPYLSTKNFELMMYYRLNK